VCWLAGWLHRPLLSSHSVIMLPSNNVLANDQRLDGRGGGGTRTSPETSVVVMDVLRRTVRRRRRRLSP